MGRARFCRSLIVLSPVKRLVSLVGAFVMVSHKAEEYWRRDSAFPVFHKFFGAGFTGRIPQQSDAGIVIIIKTLHLLKVDLHAAVLLCCLQNIRRSKIPVIFKANVIGPHKESVIGNAFWTQQ